MMHFSRSFWFPFLLAAGAMACSDENNAENTQPDADGTTDTTDDADGSAESGDVIVTDTDAGIPIAPATVYPLNDCETLRIPHGFSWAWEGYNHRVSRMGIGPSDPTACSSEQVTLTFVGGDFTTGAVANDDAIVVVEWADVQAPTQAWRVVLEGRSPYNEPAFGTATFAELGIDATISENWVAVVEGWDLDTRGATVGEGELAYDTALGFTVRGFQVWAETLLDAQGGGPRLQWALGMGLGTPEDTFLRPDLTNAVGLATTGVTLTVLVLPLDAAPQSHEGRYDLQQTTGAGFTSDIQAVGPPSERTLPWTAPAEGSAAADALGGFTIELFPRACVDDTECINDATCEADACTYADPAPGEYIRSLTVRTTPPGDAQNDGSDHAWLVHVGNESLGPAFYRMRYDASGRWWSLPLTTVAQGRTEATFAAGSQSRPW